MLSGLAGMVGMIAVMNLYAATTNQFTKVIQVLGSMISVNPNYVSPGKNSLIIGSLAHFGVGVIFSFGLLFVDRCLWTIF